MLGTRPLSLAAALSIDDTAAALQAGLHAALTGDVVASELTPAEKDAWQHWQHVRYGDTAWVTDRQGPRP